MIDSAKVRTEKVTHLLSPWL